MAEMEIQTVQQLQQLLISLMIGAGWDILWEALSTIKPNKYKCVGFLSDVIFIGLCLGSLFVLIQGPGQGQLRLFMLLAAVLGFIIIHSLIGDAIRKFFHFILGLIVQIAHIVLKPLEKFLFPAKKVKIFFKNLYANEKNWFTITHKQQEGTDTHTPFLRKGTRSGAASKVSDRRDFGGPDSLWSNGAFASHGAAISGRDNTGTIAADRSRAESEYAGIAIRYE